jgi:hypothetical protein
VQQAAITHHQALGKVCQAQSIRGTDTQLPSKVLGRLECFPYRPRLEVRRSALRSLWAVAITANHSAALIATNRGNSSSDIDVSDSPLFQKSLSTRNALKKLPGNKVIRAVPQRNAATFVVCGHNAKHANPTIWTTAKKNRPLSALRGTPHQCVIRRRNLRRSSQSLSELTTRRKGFIRTDARQPKRTPRIPGKWQRAH